MQILSRRTSPSVTRTSRASFTPLSSWPSYLVSCCLFRNYIQQQKQALADCPSSVLCGVMKLEATKFRPREVVKHVLQTATTSLQKSLTLEGHVADDVPVEVVLKGSPDSHKPDQVPFSLYFFFLRWYQS